MNELRVEMKKTVIFGSGMMGTMISRSLGAEFQVISFADGNPGKWGTSVRNIPVLPLEEALRGKPDCVCLGVLDAERERQMEDSLARSGFQGEILFPGNFLTFDPRMATMRLWAEKLNGEDGVSEAVEGDCAELGVFRGDFAVQINSAFPDRTLHLFDTFEGFSPKDVGTEKDRGFSLAKEGDFGDVNQQAVYDRMPYPDRVLMYRGYFPDTFSSFLPGGIHENTKFVFVSLDVDLYEPTKKGLLCFWPRMAEGGVIMVHDYNSKQFQGVIEAVTEFCREVHVSAIPVCDLHGSVILRKER